MTITSHRIERGSPTGGVGSGAAKYAATVWVESDDCQDTGHAVLQYLFAQGFRWGRRWEFGNDSNDNAYLAGIAPPRLVADSMFVWQVQLAYEEQKLGVAVGSNTITPVDLLPEIEIDSIGRSEVVEKATYLGGLGTGWTVDEERQVTNSANTPYVPALESDVFNQSIRVSRLSWAITDNETNFPTRWINSNTFTLSNGFITKVFEPYQLKFTGWSHRREQLEDNDVVRTSFSGEYRKKGWREELLDRGTMVDSCSEGDRQDGRGHYYNSNGDPVNIAPQRNLLDRAGLPVNQPVNLDGNGNALPACSDDRFYGQWGPLDEIDPTALAFFSNITS